MNRKLVAIIIISTLSAAMISSSAWVAKSKHQFGGIWVGIDPTNPDTAIFYTMLSADDVVGKREFTYYINHFNFDASFGGLFSDAVIFGDGVGHGYATGKNTYAISSIICALDERGFVQYYMIGAGTAEWINDDEVEADFTISIYMPDQDTDPYDGIPDEGQTPALCFPVTLYMQRVPHFTPCTPPPM